LTHISINWQCKATGRQMSASSWKVMQTFNYVWRHTVYV